MFTKREDELNLLLDYAGCNLYGMTSGRVLMMRLFTGRVPSWFLVGGRRRRLWLGMLYRRLLL